MMKIRLGMVVALLALVLPIAAQADPATRQTVDVTGWNDHIPAPTPDIHGTASLVRTDDGISMTFRTSGLPAGEPVTIWSIIVDGKGVVSGQFAAGHVVGNDGVASFAGHLAEGDTSGCFHPLFACAGLSNARMQTVIRQATSRRGRDRPTPPAARPNVAAQPGASHSSVASKLRTSLRNARRGHDKLEFVIRRGRSMSSAAPLRLNPWND
jgi:hypothetical protein